MDDQIPAPTPAAIAQPSAVASLTTGTLTVSHVTSAGIRLQSVPFEPPSANTSYVGWIPIKSAICCKMQVDTMAAFTSSALKRVALLHISGSMDRLMKEG